MSWAFVSHPLGSLTFILQGISPCHGVSCHGSTSSSSGEIALKALIHITVDQCVIFSHRRPQGVNKHPSNYSIAFHPFPLLAPSAFTHASKGAWAYALLTQCGGVRCAHRLRTSQTLFIRRWDTRRQQQAERKCQARERKECARNVTRQ